MNIGVPIVGLISALAAALGIYGLYWYENLSKEEKAQADKLACDYAKSLYNKAVNQLTSSQLDLVQSLVKAHFAK